MLKPDSIIVKIPPLEEGDKPAEIWFERGMFWFRDPKNLESVREVSMSHMRDAMNLFNDYLKDDDFKPHCGILAFRNFVHQLNELWAYSKTQLNSLTDPNIIEQEAKSRKGTKMSMYVPGLISTPFNNWN